MTRSLFLAALAALFAVPALHAQSFQGLGAPPSPYTYSEAVGVSADGEIVAGSASGFPVGYGAIRWQNGTMTLLGGLEEEHTSAGQAISANGSAIVGTSMTSSGLAVVLAVRWQGSIADLGTLPPVPPSETAHSYAQAVSANGSVVVGYSRSNNVNEAFRWQGGGMSGLGFLDGGIRSEAYGVSGDGSVVVGIARHTNFTDEAFRWTAATGMQGLGDLEGGDFNSGARAISADGRVIVGYGVRADGAHAVRWVDGVIEEIGPGVANAVSADGSVIVGSYGNGAGAFVWTAETGFRVLRNELIARGVDITGWSLLSATGVSADGTVIVGRGRNPGFVTEGWRAVLPREEAPDIVVTTTGDEPNDPASTDDDVCDVDRTEPEDQCTLRAAIELANERGGATITFDIPGGGVPTINVAAEGGADAEGLPPFTAPVIVDGTTQPGGWVELVGPGQEGRPDSPDPSDDPLIAGLEASPVGGGSEIRGLVIHGFRDAGIMLRMGADGCVIEGNRIGTDVTGTEWRGNGSRPTSAEVQGSRVPNITAGGVEIYSSGNTISNNVISGNVKEYNVSTYGGTDVYIGPSAFDNRVIGNRIGVGATGHVVTVPPVQDYGWFRHIGIAQGGGGRTIIGESTDAIPSVCAGSCNHIAGHTIEVYLGTWQDFPELLGPIESDVAGNFIGADNSGNVITPNFPDGISVIMNAQEGLVTNHLVSYNIVGAYDRGISMGGIGDEIVGNVVRGAPDRDPPGANVGYWGIGASGENITVRGNDVRRATRWGIAAEGTNIQIETNELSENPTGGIWVGEGTATIRDNHIHDNGIGVLVDGGAAAQIRINRIYDNAIGIDLTPGTWEGDGVTLNDYGDPDEGGNGLLNFPTVFQATLDDGTLTVSGFVSTPLLSTATYTVDAYLSAGCRSRAHRGGMTFGQGERFTYGYQTVTSQGEADVDFNVGSVPPGFNHVSLTTTREDLGMTSEFSECVPIVGPDEAASADVGPDETGPVFDDLDATVARTSTSRATGGPTAQRGGGGTLFVTRYATRPERNVFADATASAPNGTQVRPETVAERNWRIADRGLTPAGGAPEATPTFEVCFGAEGAVFPAHQDAVVVVQRSVATGGLWEPLATTREAHGGAPYLCAAGVTVLGEFGLGGSEAAFPVDAEGVAPGVPRSLALGRARPNPFSGTTTLDLALPSVAMVAAEVFDALGRRVAVLHDGPLAAGVHALAFDARSLPTGVYLVRAVTEAGAVAQRVTVVR